jgi:hypothetical protein
MSLNPAAGMNYSIRTYKTFGMAAYYGAIGFFWLVDRHYQTDGIFTKIGYCYGVAFMVAAFLVSTGEQRMADIQAELNGGPDDTLADKAWAVVDQAVYWSSILAAIYFVYHVRIWDAVVSLGFPAWRLWLVLEVRRLRIRSGELRPSVFWKRAMACSAAATFLVYLLIFFTGYGPYKDIGLGSFQLYPAFLIAGIVGTLLFLIGTGAKLD